MDTKASRDNSFDIARALAFFAVIWGHLFPLHGMWFVYGFHLQVFYIAAGYFLHTDCPLGSFVAKKAKRLVVPYILVGAAISLAMMIQEYLKGKEGFDAASYLKEQLYYYYWEGTSPIGPMWFLPALFYALVIVFLLAQKKYGLGLLPFIVVGGYLASTKIWLPFFLLHGVVASGYVGIGYCVARCKKPLEEKLSNKKEPLLLGVFMCAMVIWVIFQKTMTGMVYLYANDLPRGAIDYFGSLAAVYAIWYISKKVL
nr:acyltransferase family protein [Lachnospiraceae bacterium]